MVICNSCREEGVLVTIAELIGKLRPRPAYPDPADALQFQAAYEQLRSAGIAELTDILEQAEMIKVPHELRHAHERLSARVVLRLLAASAEIERAAREAKTRPE